MKEKIFKSTLMEIKSSDEDKREITAIASSEKIDRDGDLVRVDGINIKEYKKNPVVLFAHDHSSLPIAKTTKIWKENKNLMVKMQFTQPEENSMGDTVYKLIKGDYLKSLSIGFKPDWDSAVRLEKSNGWDFKSSNLYEISIVPIPANVASVVQSKGIQKALEDEVIDELELKEIELYLDELIKNKPVEDIEEVEEGELEDLIEKAKDELEKETLENEIDAIIRDGIDELGFPKWKKIKIDRICIGHKWFTKKDLENETSDDVQDSEQTTNKVYCHKCGIEIQDNSDSDYLDKLFDDFLKPKVNKEDEEISLTDELLNQYFTE